MCALLCQGCTNLLTTHPSSFPYSCTSSRMIICLVEARSPADDKLRDYRKGSFNFLASNLQGEILQGVGNE